MTATLYEQRRRLLGSGLLSCAVLLLAVVGVLAGTNVRIVTFSSGESDGIATAAASAEPLTSAGAWASLAVLLLLAGAALLPGLTNLASAFAVLPLEVVSNRISERYGLHLDTIAPRLGQLLPSETRDALDRRARRLAWALGSTAGFALALLLMVFLFVFTRGVPIMVYALGPIAAIGLAFAQARDSAMASARYAETIESSVDLNRLDLLRAMHLPLPRNLTEERRSNRYMSQLLERGGVESSEVQYVYDRHPEHASDSRVGEDIVLDLLGAGDPSVSSDRLLTNWTGYVSAWAEDPAGQRLEMNDGIYALDADSPYTLAVRLARDALLYTQSSEVVVEDGVVGSPVVFELLVYSKGIVFPPNERRVVVALDGLPAVEKFPFRSPPDSRQDGIIVKVLQHQRLIQVLTLTAQVRGTT